MIWLLVLLALPLGATELESRAFVDAYYALGSNHPTNHKRAYTTQPARTDEFAVNLAYGEVSLAGERARAKLALQAGTSVDLNYVAEPNQDHRFIQEAFVGTKLGEVWIDGGIFLGNIGAESWISRDNWTYSRALMLDYVPYYSAGLRASYREVELHLLQGWQNISETNAAKAIGMQWKRSLSPALVFTYNNFFGDEEVVSRAPRFRGYHDVILKWSYSERWQFLSSLDLGHQSQQQNDGVDLWYAAAVTVRRVLTEVAALALRLEVYVDPHQANVVTGTENGFNVHGASLNYDHGFGLLTWRTEVRGLWSRDAIYPTKTRPSAFDGVLVSALTLAL